MNEAVQDNQWRPAGFPRDTLVFAFGALAETVAQAAFEDLSVRREYWQWMAHAAADNALVGRGYRLATAGVDGGSVVFVARAAENEFYLSCEHCNFTALVPIGFRPVDPARLRRAGVSI